MRSSSITSFIILIFFISCENPVKKQIESAPEISNSKSLPDKIQSADTLKTPIEKTVKSIDSFLLKSFDIFEFKKRIEKGNSGGASKRTYYFKPGYKGFYYCFSLFHDLKGYMGNRKEYIFKGGETGLEIITFKQYGKYQNDYLDPTEELIQIKTQMNFFDLPELAFVGLDKIDLKERLGEPSFEKEGCLVYTHKDRALILGLNSGRVKWLKYVHLNTELTSDKTIAKLYSE